MGSHCIHGEGATFVLQVSEQRLSGDRGEAMTDEYRNRTEVRIERIFEASAARVFHAWTTPEEMSRWMWASLGRDVWAEADLRVGGAYRVYSRAAGGKHQGDGWSGMCGIYVEIVPDCKLVYSQHWDADVGYNQEGMLALDEVISVTMTPVGDATRVEFVQLGIPDDRQSAAAHEMGVSESFDMLDQLLAG